MHATAPAQNLPESDDPVKLRAVEQIDFHGVTIEALPPNGDGKVWISVRRVCDALGVDPDSQRVKLATKEWACTVLITVQLPGDAQARAVYCIDLDSLPMWLATIEASRVKPAVRPLLLAFQKECARVLRDHFFGVPVARPAKTRRRLAAVALEGSNPAESLRSLVAKEEWLEVGNRTRHPSYPSDLSRAARPMTDAAFAVAVRYGSRQNIDPRNEGELRDATAQEIEAIEANDLRMVSVLAEQLAAEVRRRWPELVALLTIPRRLPRGRKTGELASAG